jgi:hypothetical protein
MVYKILYGDWRHPKAAKRAYRYTVKRVIVFFVPGRDVTITKLSLAGNNLIIPGQGEFG